MVAVKAATTIRDVVRPNGWHVSGERRAEGDERVRCTRMLGGALADGPSECPDLAKMVQVVRSLKRDEVPD